MHIVLRKLTKIDLPAFSMFWQFYQYHQSTFDNEGIDSSGRFDIDEEYLGDVAAGDEDGVALHAITQLMLSNSLNWHVVVYEKDREALKFWDRLFFEITYRECIES